MKKINIKLIEDIKKCKYSKYGIAKKFNLSLEEVKMIKFIKNHPNYRKIIISSNIKGKSLEEVYKKLYKPEVMEKKILLMIDNKKKKISEISELTGLSHISISQLKMIIKEKQYDFLIKNIINGDISITTAYKFVKNLSIVKERKVFKKKGRSNKNLIKEFILIRDCLSGEMMNEDFKFAFDNFLDQIIYAAADNWVLTKKKTINYYIDSIKNFLED